MFRTTQTQHRLRRRGLLAGAAAAASLALVLSGCSGGGAGGDASSADTLVVYTGQAGDYQVNFNPYSPSSIGGIGAIFEPLFFVTNINTEDPVPLLGTDFAWNDAGTELTVDLREGVTWSDGEPFTADDVKFTFDMLLATPSINNSGFEGTVEAVDDAQVVLRWDEPAFVTGPSLLGRTPIVPAHIWADIDPATNVVAEPVGTGAFTLDNFRPQAFTLAANPTYWGGEPEVKLIRYLSLSGNTAGADALAAGNIDWQTGPVPDIQNVSTNYPGYDAVTVAQNQVALLTCSNPDLGCEGPQTDPVVREAIYWALNRDQVNSLAFQNTAAEISPTFLLTSTQSDLISSAVTDPIAPSTPELDRATALLEDAGYELGSDGVYARDGVSLNLTIEVVTGWTDYITAIDTMGQQLRAAGMGITASQSSWNEWTDRKSQGNFQLAIDSLGQGPAADPYYLYDTYFNSAYTNPVGDAAATNIARFSDPAVDAALAVLKATDPADTETRQVQFDLIQAAVIENMPYIPVMTGGTTSQYHSSKFTGWPTEDDLYAFPAIWASPDNAQVFKNLRPTGE